MPVNDTPDVDPKVIEFAQERQSDGYVLETPEIVVAVKEGTVSIFSQELTETDLPGRRHYLFDSKAGDFVFAIPEAKPSWRMIYDQAKIEILPAGKFFELSDKKHVAEAIDRWAIAISSCLLDLPSPVSPVILSQEVSCCLLAGQEATVESGVLWVQVEKGYCNFLGQEEFPISAGAPPFPLTTKSWLLASEEATLHVFATEQLIENDTVREALHVFHLRVADVLQEKLAKENLKRQEDAVERSVLDHSRLYMAVNQFRQILAPEEITEEVSSPGSALFHACRLIGNVSNLDFRRPTRIRESKKDEDAISMIAFESRCRYRWVRYERDWWRQDFGPLLGFKGEENSPVALLPKSGSYVCIDPASGLSQVVDEKLADSLGKNAIVFYRSLPDSPQNAWQIMRFGLLGQGKEFFQIWTSAVAAGLLSLVLPIAAGRLFRETIPSANYSELYSIIIILVAVCLSQAVFQTIRLLHLARIEQKSGNELEAAMWDRILRLPVPFFRLFTVGDLMDRIMSVSNLRQNFSRSANSLFYLYVISVCNLALMLKYDAQVALIIIALAILGLLLLLLCTNARVKIEKERMKTSGQFVALSLNLIGNVSKLRLAGADLRALSIWANKAAENQRLLFSGSRIETAITCELSLTPVVCTALLFAGIATYTPRMSVEDFITFNVALGQFLAALLSIYRKIPDLQLLQTLFQRLEPLVEAVPEPEQTATDPGLLRGAIEFQSVSVSYEEGGEAVLSDVSFRINPGEFIAVVGKSGSGKTTLLRTLIGFEKPVSGSVIIDGQNLSELDLRSVRKQIGVVLQNDKLIPGSVYLNIVGNSDLTKADAWDAAEMAGIDKDIHSWPMGMDTALIEGAGTISGGQKQRIMVARAVVRKPRILVFDEATSALDNKTQTTIIQGLRRLNATRIVVAQRLSTVQHTDRIYVMDKGRIAEVGTFKELMAAGGVFAELARRQLA